MPLRHKKVGCADTQQLCRLHECTVIPIIRIVSTFTTHKQNNHSIRCNRPAVNTHLPPPPTPPTLLFFTICWISTNSALWTAALSQTNPLSRSSKNPVTPLLPLSVTVCTISTGACGRPLPPSPSFPTSLLLLNESRSCQNQNQCQMPVLLARAHFSTRGTLFASSHFCVGWSSDVSRLLSLPIRSCLRTTGAPFPTPQRA